MSYTKYLEMNQAGWNQRAKVHFESKFYDVNGFLSGQTSLREIELAELSDVVGKRLLHLQCHFGMDTLSWARLGAVCTGVDISPVAIEKARELASETRLHTRFVCSDVYSFRRSHSEPYEIVFTSYGALCWLPDLSRWAEIVASNLAVGGLFYMVEFHPFCDLLEGYSYFTQTMPDVEEQGTYTENGADLVTRLATWPHTISGVVNALVDAGIHIVRINEFPFSPYDCFEDLVEREPGRIYLTHRENDVPLVYSITGRKIAEQHIAADS